MVLYLCIVVRLNASEKYTAVGYYNNYPYEYLNNEGKPSGFTVELFMNLIKNMDIRCDILLLPQERVAEILCKGEAEIIIGGVESGVNRKYLYAGTTQELLFTFTASKDSDISDFKDLAGRRIAVAGNENLSVPLSDIIRKLYNAEVFCLNNPETAILLLDSKGCDAVFMQNYRLKDILLKLNNESIKELYINPGVISYGIYVRDGYPELLNKIRTGLNRIHNDGTYKKIYSKWFSQDKSSEKVPDKEFVIIWFFVSASVFIFFIYINTHILRKRINDKTVELNNTIADLKKTEADLAVSERKFRKIFDKSPAGILILDPAGRIIHFNESIKTMFGLTNYDEVYNINIIESPNADEWFKTRLKKYHSISLEFKYDFDIIRRTGFYQTTREGEIIIDASIYPFSLYHESERMGYICHFIDVTQNRMLLHYRKETARRYEVMFDSVRDGLWEWRLDDDTIRINRQFVNMLGYRKDNLPETFNEICELIHPEEKNDVLNHIKEKISRGRSFSVEYRILKNDGLWLWIKSRGEVTEWDHDLSPVMVVATHSDISQLKAVSFNNRDSDTMTDNYCIIDNGHSPCNYINGRKVLIVDDNFLITLHLSEILTRSGFNCVNARSGLEAIEIVKKDREFDLILLDIEMPELDGMTTMKLIKEIKNDIPVIANTGHCDSNCTDTLLFSGFDDVLSKPVQEVLLIEKISRLLSFSSNRIIGDRN